MSQRMQLEALASRLPLNVAQARQSEAQRVLQGLLAQPVLPPTRRPWLVRFARGFTALFMVQTLLAVAPAYAQITATPGAASGQKPLMDAAANGTPIVLVAPPSRAGVSRNLYEQFNVGAKGLILNNSTGNVQTQLGGWISGNLQLGQTSARIILNEVTGANASQLKGYIEIGGQKADLVIANPNGIRCDGCGFLNANRATLATGTPQFGADGALTGLDVRQGVISVGPGGLDATQQQQLDLMARSASVQGEVFAQKLQAIIGANQVDYGSLAATPQSGNGDAPRFAVDIKDLGGMYAGQIYLIATEKGLGVNSTGRLSTLAGNLTLSVNGDLTLKDSYSAQDMQLAGTGKTALTGQTLAEGAARIDAPQQMVNSGALQAATLVLNTPGVQNSGSIAQIAPGADLALSLPGGLVNSGAIYTPGSLSVSAASVTSGAADTAGSNLRNATGSLRAGAGLRIEAGTLDLQGQQLAANQDIRVQAGTLRATASSLSAGGQVALEGAGAVELTDTTVVAGSGARVSGQSIAIDRSKIAALGNVQLASAQRFSADAAELSSNAALSVQGASVSLRAGTVTAVTTAGMASDGEIRLDASVVTAGQQVSLQGQGINTAGATVAAARVGIDAGAGALNNEGGKVAASSTAADALSVSAAGIHNKGGELRANGGLSLDARGGRIDNTQGVIAGTSGTLTNLGGLSNKGGIVYTESDLNLSGTALDNSLGAIVTKGRLTVATPGSAILNAGGLLQADGAIALDAGSAALDNSAGTVVAGGGLSVSAGQVDTTAGTLAAGGQLDVTTGRLTGNGASLGSGGAMNLSVSDEASLSTAAANAGGHLTLNAGSVQAAGAVLKSNGNTQVTASAISGGLWQAQGDVIVSTQGALNVAGGGLLAGGNVSATGQGITTDSAQVSGQNVVLDAGAGTLSNVGGKISAVAAMGTALHVRAHGIDNTGGTLNSTADAILDASGQTLDNTGGTIQVTGRLQMLAGELVNRKGVLNADSALSLQGFALDNNGGAIYSKGNLSIDTAGRTLDNTGGSLKADGHTSLSAGAILSSGGAISAGTAAADGAITRAGTVTVRAASLDSSSGRISGTQELDILVTQRLAVAGATLETGGRLSAGAASIDAAGASLSAGAALSVIATGALDLTGASIKSAGDASADLALSGESLAARGATVHGNAAVSLSSGGTLDAGAAQVSAVKALSITAPGAVTLEAGSFKANEQLALSGASVAAAGAALSAGGRADITATAGAVDLNRATLLAGDAARVTATGIAAGAAVIGAVGSVTLQAGTGDFTAPKVLVQSQSGSISLNAATVNAAGSTPAGATPTTGFIAAQAIAITATGAVDVSEALTSAGASVAITSGGAIHNDGGRVLANTTAELTGTTLGNQGGVVDATGPLRISVGAGQVVNDQGRISTRDVLSLTAPGGALSSLSNAGGIIDTAGAFDVQLQNFNNAGGSVTALAGLSIAGGPVANTDGTLASNGSVSVNTQGGTFTGERGQVLSAEGKVTLITGAAALDGVDLMAKGDITVNAAGAVTAGQAQIAAGGSASITATTGIDLHSGSIKAQTIGLQAGTGQINNTAGTLSALATTGTALSLQSQGLLNDGGAIASGADLSVNAGAANLANAGGNMLAVGAADIRSTGLDNTNGTIASNGALTINAAQASALADTNNTGGTIRSAQSSLSLTTGALTNTAGQISAQGGNATLVVSSYANNAGSVIAGGALSLNAGAGAITANGATFASGGAMTLRGGAAQFNDASVTAGGAIDAVVSGLQANRATVQAVGQLTVDAGGGAIAAANSIWKAAQGVSLAGGNTTLSDATVSGNGAIAVSGANIDATRASIATAADVRVQASGVLNMGEATLLAGQDLIATGTGAGVTAGASAMAGRDLVLGNAAAFDFAAPGMQFGFGRDLTVLAQGINTAGRTVAARRLTLDAGGGLLNNQGGTLQATDSLSASGTGLNNQAGVIAANGQVTVNAGAGALNNASGQIYSAQGSASVAGSGIQNSSGVIASVASTTADAGSGTLTNTAGRVSGQSVAVGGAVNNASGVISGSSAVAMITRELNNDAGVIESGAGGISINTQGNTLSNTQSGSTRGVVSQGGIAIQAGAIDNQGGYIGANGGLNITQSASIDNRQGTLLGLGNSAITTSGVLDNAGGAIQSNADLTLNAATLNNSGAGSIVFANGNLIVNATTINNTGNKTSAFTTGLLAGGNASISAATIDNTGGAIVSLGDTSVVATSSVGNAGGQIAGNTVSIETPVLTNTGGRADAQRRMSLKVPKYSADGVLASNGDLELIMQGDQLNTGTFSANGSLSVSTTGVITNRGHISAQNRLSLTATGFDNAAGAIIDSQATTLNTAGVVNNAGLINSTSGTTAINAATLNNVGRVYGDSVVISGAANNGQDASGAGAVIASRAGDVSVGGAVNNTDGGYIFGLGDIRLNGPVWNDGSILNASGNITIAGELRNSNAGLSVDTQTRSEAASGSYITPSGSTTRYSTAELGWRSDSGGHWVLPSATYPIATFGVNSLNRAIYYYGCGGGDCSYGSIYSTSDPIWALMRVTSPGAGPGPVPTNCVSGGGESGDIQLITTGACGTYWASYDSYQASASSAYAQLDSAITAFNADLQSRVLIDWYETTITGKTIVETHVTGSKPGQVLAGGNITVAGGVNYDSIIVAGGNVSAGTGVNYATPGTRQTTEEGTMVFSHREYHGGFSNSYSRSVSAPQPIPASPVTETFNLPVLQFLPNTVPNTAPTPAGTSTPVGAATAIVPGVGASATSARSASGVGGASAPVGSASGGAVTVAATTTGAPPLAAGVSVTGADPRNASGADLAASLNAAPQLILPGSVIAATVRSEQSQAISTSQANFAALAATLPQLAQAVDTSQRRSPPPTVKAAGYTTVSASGPVRAPNIQLFSLNRGPSGPLVETDPAFTSWRRFISSAYFLLQLNIDPERTLKLYGDGFAEQRLIDDQILALTGRRFLSNYTSTEDEYQDLLNAGVMYARQYQLSPGVALSAEQMATLTTDMVWLETRAVILPNGSTVQALVPTVYLRRPVDGDLTPTGALIAGSNVTLRSPGDIASSGTVYASGDAAQGNGRLTVEGANINNSGALAGNAISITAQDTINNAGGVIQGLGDSSTAALNARDITLRTTTQTSVREIAGPNGVSTGSTTNADRIATVSADAVTLAALNDINLSGAVVKATGDLTATAGGAITTEAVATGYTLNIPLGGGGAQGRSSNYSADATTQQLSTLQAGSSATLTADGDANLKGTNISAGADIAITAQNITIEAAKDSLAIGQQGVNKRGFERVAKADEALTGGVFTAGNSASLSATAGNLTATGAVIAAGTDAATLNATGNVVIQNATTQHSQLAESYDSNKGMLSTHTKTGNSNMELTQVEGSSVSGNTVAVTAGNNATVQASLVNAVNALTVRAGNDVTITTAQQSLESSSSRTDAKTATGLGKALGVAATLAIGPQGAAIAGTSKSNGQTADQASSTAVGSTLTGGTVAINSGRDTAVQGSTVIADSALTVTAGRNLSVTSAQDTATGSATANSKTSGFVGDLWQPAIGVVKQNQASQDGSTTQSGSTLASLGGNVTLRAGEQYTQTASNVVALQGDAGITAKKVTINEAQDTQTGATQSEYSKTAVGGAISVPVLNAVRTIDRVVEAASDTGNTRVQALAAATAALNAKAAIDSATELAAGNLGGIKVSVSLGSSKNESQSTQQSSTAVGSSVSAQNVAITATGEGANSNIDVTGSNITAANNVSLKAEGQVILQAGTNTAEQHSTNSSSGWSVGIGFALGGAQNGFTLEASASKGRGNADGTDTSYTNSHVSGSTVSIESAGDTTLKGAVVQGNQVTANVGGNLNIESLQDRSTFDSKQTSAGVGISLCIPPFCYGASTVQGGSVSAGRTNIDSNFQSVTEQSGIKAGDGGFNVDVKGATVLTGGVIASTEKAVAEGKNVFTPGGPVIATDIQNNANFDAKGFSITAGVGTQLSSSKAGIGQADGQASGTTSAGISGVAGNTAVRSTDAPTGVAPIFNPTKVTNDVNAQISITGAFGQSASKAAGDYANNQWATAVARGDTEEAARWAPDGSSRAALHAGIGALTGGVAGAAGAAGASMTGPQIGAAIHNLGLPETVTQGLTQAVILAAAGATGGTAAAAGAFNETANNNMGLAIKIGELGAQASRGGITSLTASGLALLTACVESPVCNWAVPVAVAAALVAATKVATTGSSSVDQIPTGGYTPVAPDGRGGNTVSPAPAPTGNNSTTTPGTAVTGITAPASGTGGTVTGNGTTVSPAGTAPVGNLVFAVPAGDRVAINTGLAAGMGTQPVVEQTTGRGVEISRYPTGTLDDANRVFDNMPLSGVRSFDTRDGGVGRQGVLPDGTTVIVRPVSSDGAPTIQIIDNNRGNPRTVVEVRFGSSTR